MLNLLALNCTLKPTGSSSTDKLLREIVEEVGSSADAEIVRVAALNIKPGVTSDEGEGDDWPTLRKKIAACDILLIGSPIWLGQPSSVAKRVLEKNGCLPG